MYHHHSHSTIPGVLYSVTRSSSIYIKMQNRYPLFSSSFSLSHSSCSIADKDLRTCTIGRWLHFASSGWPVVHLECKHSRRNRSIFSYDGLQGSLRWLYVAFHRRRIRRYVVPQLQLPIFH